MNDLFGTLQKIQQQGEKQLDSGVWRQVLVLLLLQLRVKRERSSLEDTLPDRTLRVIMNVLPKAVPELTHVFTAFCSQDVQADMLQNPNLRANIDEKVLSRMPDLMTGSAMQHTEVLSALFMTIMQSALPNPIDAKPPPSQPIRTHAPSTMAPHPARMDTSVSSGGRLAAVVGRESIPRNGYLLDARLP